MSMDNYIGTGLEQHNRDRRRRWDAQNMASATCRLRADDYRMLIAAAEAQGSTVNEILRRLAGAYLAMLGVLPDASPIWPELEATDAIVTPFFRRKKWVPAQKLGPSSRKKQGKIIDYAAYRAKIDRTSKP